MKQVMFVVLVASAILIVVQHGEAQEYRVALSPPAASALNLGTETYPGDHAPGLSALNESNMPSSLATGGVVGNGILYDLGSNMLTFDFAYGSAFGFVDLTSDWNGGIHIHGSGANTAQFPAANTNAGVIISLGTFHTASGARSGRATGSVTLSDTHEGWLLNNQLYVNVHTVNNTGGEIRGQLVLVPEPMSALLAMCGAVALVLRRRTR